MGPHECSAAGLWTNAIVASLEEEERPETRLAQTLKVGLGSWEQEISSPRWLKSRGAHGIFFGTTDLLTFQEGSGEVEHGTR